MEWIIIILIVGFCIVYSVEKICVAYVKGKRLDNGWNEQGTMQYLVHTDKKGTMVFNEFRENQK